jgi:hypothetical protein
MNIVERVQNIIVKPTQEWDVIAKETHTVPGLFTGYVMILAAIPAVSGFIGYCIVGFGGYRVPMAYGLAHMVVSYVLSLAFVYVMALIIDALAPQFEGERNFMQALKVAAFFPTAAWLAGIFSIIPLMSILTILGLYSLYLLYLGLPRVMKASEEKAMTYAVVVVIVAIVLWAVVAILSGLAMPGRMRGF